MKNLISVLICFILLSGCMSGKKVTEKAYIAVSVEQTIAGTYYTFVNLSQTYGREFLLHDSAKCNPGDTIIIKDLRKNIFVTRTVFIKYQ